MEKRGIASERGDLNRDIAQRNVDRRALKALDAEARKTAAAIIELETGRAAADQRQAASSRYDDVRATQQENIEAERRATSETVRVFGSAADRTTEPRVENFDRDAANADWADRVAAAGIANDRTTTPQEARQQPGDSAARETSAFSEEATADRQAALASQAAIEEPGSSKTASRASGGFASVVEAFFGGLARLFVAEPKLTRDQAIRAERVADERAEANAVAAAAQHEQDIRHRLAEQQRIRDIARTLQVDPVSDPEEDRFRSIMQRSARDRDRDREHERER
jgi:THO complex subunit 2